MIRIVKIVFREQKPAIRTCMYSIDLTTVQLFMRTGSDHSCCFLIY